MSATMVAHPSIGLRWSFGDDVEVKTKSVEKFLEPLVAQVTTLVKSPGGKSKSKKVDVLAAAVVKAIENFISKGEEIVRDNPAAKEQLTRSLDEVKNTGGEMGGASRGFAAEPRSSQRRQTMVEAARALLKAVTRFMILCDMIDVQLLLRQLQAVRADLEQLKKVQSQDELNERFGRLGQNLDALNREAGKRAADLRDPDQRDDLQAARAMLKTSTPVLYTASKVSALENMEDVIEGRKPRNGPLSATHGHVGALIDELERFSNRVYLDPQTYDGRKARPELEGQLERIVSGAALIADSENTRPDRKQRIVDSCNNLRQALQDLLSEYERNVGKKEPDENLDMALVNLGHEARDLARHLRRAVVDHLSDAFLDTRIPLMVMIEAAKRGDVDGVEEAGRNFQEYADKLVEVSELCCKVSKSEEGRRLVRYAAQQLEKLAPQVVNAARLLAARPDSKVAMENMDAFKEAWEEKVKLLTLSVDSIITVDDFLAVSEAHIVEDVKACIQAIVHKDGDTLDRTAGAIRGRSLRVCDVVEADMEMHEPGPYADKVRNAVKMLSKRALPTFAERASNGVASLNKNEDVSLDEFIDAATVVHDAIKDIRHALLMNRHTADIDSDNEYEESASQAQSKTSGAASQQDNTRNIMRQLPEQDKKKIQEQIDVFKVVQTKFEREVAKWDEAGNDIIVLAKYMCMIMMEMTDFTRGRGPLKRTSDVIQAAVKISEAGEKLKVLSSRIADESVASETKKDLHAYLQRITLYCHQLKITSKVKADVQQVGDELVVSGLESAMSLIQTARNLLNAVVLTVKSAYIASTKYKQRGDASSALVVWKMRAPEKQPLIRPQKPIQEEGKRGIIRRASDRRPMPPIQALAEFNAA